ncbi:hypothetical protein OBG91_05275 [Lactococcus lactis]|nr:hypothetical protein [Lactococcus lactis]
MTSSFYIPNETEALGLLNEIGLMFPPDSMTRKKYYSLYQEKELLICLKAIKWQFTF